MTAAHADPFHGRFVRLATNEQVVGARRVTARREDGGQ